MSVPRIVLNIFIGLAVLVGVAIAAFHFPRMTDAYVALEAGEMAYPARGSQAERVRLANAMAEGEAPRGLTVGERLHPVGTLAHLRYETLRRDGEVASVIEVRALVPPLPYFGKDAPGGPHGRIECPKACTDYLAWSEARLIDRGGSPGIASEWVMRMPVGRPFELPSESFQLQDLEDPRPISFPVARYRVTLLEACHAKVRMGSIPSIDWHPFATLPIPRGIHVSRWMQVDGCASLLARKPARAAPAPVIAAVSGERPAYAYSPPKLGLVVAKRDSPMGNATLVVDENAKLEIPETVHVRFLAACRFDAASRAWIGLPVADGDLEVAGPGLMGRVRVAYRFPERGGLYWARWTETRATSPEPPRTFAVVVPSGAALRCRESELPQPQQGEISLCVPGNGPAQPSAIPDPEIACGKALALAR